MVNKSGYKPDMALNNQNASDLVLHTALRSLVPVNVLPTDTFNSFARHIQLETAPAGTELFHYGDTNEQVVYLLSGEVVLKDRNGTLLQGIRGGTDRARYPLAHELPREATAMASTDVAYVHIDMHELNRLMSGEHSVDHQIGDIRVSDIHDVHDDDWITAALQSSLFENLPPANLQVLLTHLIKIPVKQGEVIIKQGEIPNYYYYIRQGRCEVTRRVKGQDKPVVLAELQEGEGFGEEALIAYGRRNASVTMLTDGVLMRLSNGDFKMLMERPLLKSIKYIELDDYLADGAELIDVRDSTEFRDTHLPGSRNIPYQAIRETIPRLDPDKTYITCSNSGRRSAVAAFLLKQRGIEARFLDEPHLPGSEPATIEPEEKIDIPTIEIQTQPQGLGELEELRKRYEDLQQQYQRELELREKIEYEKSVLLDEKNELEKIAGQQASLGQVSAEAEKLAADAARLRIEKDLAKKELDTYRRNIELEAQRMEEETRALHELEETRQETLKQVEELRSNLRKTRQDAEDTHRKAEYESEQLELETERLKSIHDSRLREEKDLVGLEARKLELQRITNQRDELQHEIEVLTGKLDNAHQQLKTLQGEIQSRNDTLAELEKLHVIQEDKARQDEEVRLTALETGKRELEDMSEQRKALHRELEKLSGKVSQRREELASIQHSVQAETEKLTELEITHINDETTERESAEMEKKLADLENQVETAQQRADEANQQLEEKTALLKEVETRYEEYQQLGEQHRQMQEELATLRQQLASAHSQLEETTRNDEEERLVSKLSNIEAREEAIRIKAEAEQLKLRAEEEALQLRAEAEKTRLKTMEDISRARAEAEKAQLQADSEVKRIKEELARLRERKQATSKNKG